MNEIEKIRDLTREVETLVGDARWEEAAAKEAERRALVTRYVEEHPQRVEDLRPVYESGQRARELVKVQRRGLVAEANSFLHNVRGLKAYRANGPMQHGAKTRG